MPPRPTRFEHSRYLGDKRSQIVYDLDDAATPPETIAEIVENGVGASFGPDTLAEARNRNYRPYGRIETTPPIPVIAVVMVALVLLVFSPLGVVGTVIVWCGAAAFFLALNRPLLRALRSK